MKKRFMAVMIALCMIVAATGCGKNYTIAENGAVYNDHLQINKWKGLEVEKVEPAAVTDADIDAAIESDIQTEWKKVGVKDRAAVDGDTVVIDFVGKKDGIAFEGGTSDDYFLKLGSKSFIDGFEAGVVGEMPGETFDLNLTFPADYGNAELAGKAVVFTVTLDAIIPAYSEALVPLLSDKATTTAEYREEVKKELEVSNQETADASMRDSLLSVLLEQCEVLEYPEERLEEITECIEKPYTEYLQYMISMYYGSVEQFEQTSGTTIKAMVKEGAESQLLCELAVQLIAEVEGIEFTDKEYKAFLKEQTELEGYESVEEYEEKFEETNGEGATRIFGLQEKVLDFLWENCKIVEPKEESTTVTE